MLSFIIFLKLFGYLYTVMGNKRVCCQKKKVCPLIIYEITICLSLWNCLIDQTPASFLL